MPKSKEYLKKKGCTEFQAEPCPWGGENNLHGAENETAFDKLLFTPCIKQISKTFALKKSRSKLSK